MILEFFHKGGFMSRKVVTREMAIEFVSWLETLFFVTEDGPAVSISRKVMRIKNSSAT